MLFTFNVTSKDADDLNQTVIYKIAKQLQYEQKNKYKPVFELPVPHWAFGL